ncbi:MAG: hypothetical protein HQM12_21610 [SAR324 cluster bacterium]|nr:hypothetical protein [SAR324 cluster bacterium]
MITREERAEILKKAGACPSEIEELLAYNTNYFQHQQPVLEYLRFPLEDELFVTDWKHYIHEAEQQGAFHMLQKKLVELQFPVQPGISMTSNYTARVRKGLPPPPDTHLPRLKSPEKLNVLLCQSLAGKIPFLITEDRADFETLIQSLAMKNEPVSIPLSLNAFMVSGYNNWDRFHKAEQQAQQNWNGQGSVFNAIAAEKKLYQDSFVICTFGSYSNVPSREMGFTDAEWQVASFVIRQEHECAHYILKRLFGITRNNILDELIADFMGICAYAGKYKAEWFLRFMGVDQFPVYRENGRLSNYRGDLSDSAFAILQGLIVSASHNLQSFYDQVQPLFSSWYDLHIRFFICLTYLTLEEMSAMDGVKRMILAMAELENSLPEKAMKPVV